MINISWQDRTTNDDILRKIKLKRKMLDAIANIERNEISHRVRRKCLLALQDFMIRKMGRGRKTFRMTDGIREKGIY